MIRVGDRVCVDLPDRSARRHQGRHVAVVPVFGTVAAVDLPGLPRGVQVALDRTVNGVDTCYATYAEVEFIELGGQE